LKDVPNYSTICKAVKRLKEDDLRDLVESSKLLGVKLEDLAVDSTGLRADTANSYYAKKSEKVSVALPILNGTVKGIRKTKFPINIPIAT